MEGGDTGGYSLPGWSLSSVGASFPYVGGCFRTWAVVLVRGRLSRGGGGGGLPWLVLVLGCHIAVSDVAPGFPVSKESGGRGCLHTCWWSLRLVTWPLDVIGEGVVLGARRRWCRWWVVCCRPAIVVAWSSSVVVVVVVSHHCRRSWLLTWCSCVIRMVYRRVQVVVGGGRWCGDDGWASWVGVVSGRREWALWVGIVGGGGWWWWWLRKKEVVVC